jgi:hypothetical protein
LKPRLLDLVAFPPLRVPGETTNASQKRQDAERIPLSKSEQRLELYLNLLAERNGL